MKSSRAHHVISFITVAGSLLTQTSKSFATVFDLERLPLGKSVTIPRPATTHIPLKERAHLGATDLPQSISFRATMGAKQSLSEGIKLAIYDSDSEHVQYVLVRPGTPFIYPMRKLAKIMVIAQEGPAGAKIQVESDKPLEIGR